MVAVASGTDGATGATVSIGIGFIGPLRAYPHAISPPRRIIVHVETEILHGRAVKVVSAGMYASSFGRNSVTQL